MKYVVAFVALFALTLAGCVTSLPRDQPFTKAWTSHQRHEQELQDRVDRMNSGELVLLGHGNGTRAAIALDEEGDPKLNVGRRKGISADVDVNTDDASVLFKYKRGWKTKAPPADNRESD